MTKEPFAAAQDKFVLRLPDGLRDRIAASAKDSGRSMNAEIIQVLMQYFPPEPPLEELIENIEMFVNWSKADTGYSPAWKRNLSSSLTDLVERLKRGEVSKLIGPRVFTPEEIARQEVGKSAKEQMKEARRAQQEIIETTGPSDIDAILAAGYLNHLGSYRLDSARRILDEGSLEGLPDAFMLLNLDFELVEDPEGAAKKLHDALNKIASERPPTTK